MSDLMQETLSTVKPLPVVVRQPELALSPQRDGRGGLPASDPLWPRYLEALFKHKGFVLASIFASLLLAWGLLLVWPRQYESESKLMIRIGRESVALDPTATTSQTLMLQKTQEEEVNSALDLLRSRRVAQRTVDRLGADNIIAGSLEPSSPPARTGIGTRLRFYAGVGKDALHSLLLAMGIKEDLSANELAILELLKTLQITAERRSAVVSIAAYSATPEMAQAIAQTVSEEFMSEYLEVTHNAGSYEFFSGQAAEAIDSRQDLADQKSSFLHQRKLVDIAANQAILVEQLGAIERDVIAAEAELDQTLAEIDDVSTKLKDMPLEIIAEKKGSSDSTWSGMRQQVYALELEERQLSAKYPESNPLVIQARQKLAGAQQILDRLESERIDESSTPNPLRQGLEEDLQKLQTKVVGLQANLQLRKTQHAEVERKIAEIIDSQRALEEIEREIKMADTRLDLLRQKHEEARVLSEMQADRISNVSLFQPATLVQRPASPNKKLLFLACGLLGLVGSTTLVVCRELNSKVFRAPADVERTLGLPVVANVARVPNTSLHPDRLLKLIRKRPALQTAYRGLLSDVWLAAASGAGSARGKTIGVMGVEAGAGATTIAAALALVASESCGFETTLVDAHAENPALSRHFRLNGAPGLMELANGDATHAECIQRPAGGGLQLVSSSSAYRQQQRLDLDPKCISAALSHFQESSDLVIVDLPPAVSADRAVGLSHHLDFVLLVVQAEKTDVGLAERIARRLGGGTRPMVGVVLNQSQRHVPGWLGRMLGLG